MDKAQAIKNLREVLAYLEKEQAETKPEAIFFPDVKTAILPSVQLLGKSRIQAQEYVQDNTHLTLIDDSRDIWKIAYALKNSRKSNYDIIVNDERNKGMDKDAIKEACKNLDNEIWKKYVVWAEIAKSNTKGKVSLYRQAKVKDGEFILPKKNGTTVKMQDSDGEMHPDWKKALGVDQSVQHWTDDYQYYEEPRALRWNFRYWFGERPHLYSYWLPEDGCSYWGVLLGRK